jgi:ABC-type branched-subunit amino acid transport system ATPase component
MEESSMKTLLRMPGSAGAVLPSGPAELKCRELVKTFGGVRALRGVDLVIKPGKTLAIIGPNGAGKSSLINVLTGLYGPTSGKVMLNGEDISGKNLAARTRLGVMRTFQGTRIFSTLRVGDALALGAEAPRALNQQTSVDELAKSFGLVTYLDTVIAELPYGIQKVLNLALVSASRPRVLLLDEPFAGVHAEDVERLSVVIERFRADGVAVAVVEHNIEALLRIADSVVVLDSGALLFTGSPDEARTSPAVREAYLGAHAGLVGEKPA